MESKRHTADMYVSWYEADYELLKRMAAFYGCSYSEAFRTVIRSYAAFLRQQTK